jgi:sarcosine oxidase
MSAHYDVIVIGLGGMGSATAYQLAERGKRVLGLERHKPAHAQGSSHGKSRIIRQAYFEDPAYVPLLLRAYELWRKIEHESDTQLLTITGGLMLGPPESRTVAGALRSAQEHGLAHEMLDAAEIARRFPPLRPEPDTIALYEELAGFLHPEASVTAHLRQAERLGATLRFEEPATAWEASPEGDRVRVTTARGSYEADRLVIAPGAWAPQLFVDLDLPLVIERNVLCWFEPIGGREPFLPDRFPIYIWETHSGLQFYGFPAQDGPPGGVKVALFRAGIETTPETIDRTVRVEELEPLRASLAAHIPALNGRLIEAITCMYTTAPDEHFIIGLHPRHPQVVVASPCSGHGYKFASVIGEILADLAIDGATRHPIGLFDIKRPALQR